MPICTDLKGQILCYWTENTRCCKAALEVWHINQNQSRLIGKYKSYLLHYILYNTQCDATTELHKGN